MSVDLAVDGPAAPPRSNGELLFAAPWESRAFGLAVALHADGAFAWSRFQKALIARIAAPGERPYYEDWLGALEDVLDLGAEVDARTETLTHRPTGHDHPH
jgi:nitrile hydratase accessory protein